MKYLLDSHTLLWFYLDAPELSSSARNAITDLSSNHFVSAATIWEIAIKLSIGKLKLHESFEEFTQHSIYDNGFVLLDLTPNHAAALVHLPHHHRDPFDRMLVAQAIVEDVTLISADKALDAYPIQRVW